MLDIQSKSRGLIAHGVSACAGCGLEIGARYIVDVLGDRSTIVIPPGCAALFSGYGKETVTKIPGFQGNLENTAAYAAGIKAGYEVQGKDVTVLGMAGDGATVDIGLQSLSGALERGDKIMYICYDNEAYMNTGIQGSASTPTNAWTTTTPAGKQGYRKDLGKIVAAHRIPYLATASVGFVEDLRKKLEKAKEATKVGPSFIHLHAPCPTGWRSRPDKTIEIARLAVNTRCWPLYEVVDGVVSLTRKVENPKPLAEYFKLQGRFKGVSEEQVAAMTVEINAAYEKIAEGRLQGMTATLDEIYNARSVAVIGASQEPSKAGYQVLKQLLDRGYAGDVFPVHPKEKEILGRKCYPSILDIDKPLDLMVIAVSAKAVSSIFKQAEERGDVKGAVILSAGFAETGIPELVAAEAEVVEIAKRAGIRVFGPNCIGMAYPASKLYTGFAPGVKLIEGNAAYVSQSGAFGGALLMFAGDQPCPQGFAKFGHIGNMCDISNLELIDAFNKDPAVKVIGTYMEAVKDGRALMNIAASSEKPNLILKVGRSSIGAAAAMSHTGSLAGSDKVYDGAFKQCGIVRLNTVEEMTDGMKAVSSYPKPGGNRICVLTEAGGMGIVSMDAIEDTLLELAPISAETRSALEKTLPPMAMVCKPNGYVDMTAAVAPEAQAAALRLALSDPGVDCVLLMGLPPIFREAKEVAEAVIEGARGFDKPVAVCIMRGECMVEARRHFEEHGIMTFDTPERAVKALETLYRASHRQGHAIEELPPAPAHEVLGTAVREGRNLLEPEAVAFLKDNGIPTIDYAFVTSREEAELAAKKFDCPVVLKVVSPDVIHKSDAGGVRVNLKGPAETGAAFDDMLATVKARVPGADIRGAMVVPMAASGTELIVGMVRDPQFGPVIMFGLGGVFVEVFKDVSFRVAPFDAEVALDMIRETKAFEILNGVRGEARKDIEALAELLVNISRLAATRPEIKEIDLNPVRIYDRGLAVLDARVIL